MTPALLLSSAAVLAGFALNRIGRRRIPAEGRAAGRPLDQASTAAMVTWIGNHVGLAGLAVTGSLGGGAIMMSRGATNSSRARVAGAALASAGGITLAVIGGALGAPW